MGERTRRVQASFVLGFRSRVGANAFMPAVRLQKFLADAGIASRRAAEELIEQGLVEVNGEVATLGCKVEPGVDRVKCHGRTIGGPPQRRVTVAVNKPRGMICSNDDPNHPRTVFELLPPYLSKLRFFCAGRLDLESEGLVILTTDGELAHRLTHPSHLVTKRYRVSLEQPVSKGFLPKLIKGVVLEGERLKVERAFLLGPPRAEFSTEVEVHLHHGKKREIRQLFQVLGHDVRRLRRFQIGAFPLKGIPLRGAKVLSNRQIDLLFAAARATSRPLRRPSAPSLP
jgi:23S rRNA pseudouridine2605 synthase